MWHPVVFPKKNQYKLLHSIKTALLVNNPWDMRSSGIMEHSCFGTTYQSHLQGYAPLTPVTVLLKLCLLICHSVLLATWLLHQVIGPLRVFTNFIANAWEIISLSIILRHIHTTAFLSSLTFSLTFIHSCDKKWNKKHTSSYLRCNEFGVAYFEILSNIYPEGLTQTTIQQVINCSWEWTWSLTNKIHVL